ncbi:hypothetical protein ACHAXN_009685 [Cyclotella atomus]
MPPKRSKRRLSSSSSQSAARAKIDNSPTITCTLCEVIIPAESEHIILRPCGCKTCTRCLIRAHADRGKCLLQCCGAPVKSHKFVDPSQTTEENVVTVRTNEDNISNEILIGLWYHISKVLLRKHNSPTDEDYAKAVNAFCAWVHPQIVHPSMNPYAQIPTMRPKEFFDHAVNNFTPLLAALYGLGTGKSERDINKITGDDQKDHQSQYMAMGFARDMILRCTSRYPLHAQQSISYVSDKKQCEAVIKHLLKEHHLGANDMTLLSGDNLGFFIKGIKALYRQWILFQDILIRCGCLKKIRLHSDNVEERLDRKPAHKWLDLCKKKTVMAILLGSLLRICQKILST